MANKKYIHKYEQLNQSLLLKIKLHFSLVQLFLIHLFNSFQFI